MAKSLLTMFLALSMGTLLHAQSEFVPQVLLKPRLSGPYSIPPNVDARTGYDTLGARAGINIVYHPGFKPDIAVPLRIEGPTFFETMDRFSTQTGNFWFAWDNKTVIVAPDNQAARRDVEPWIFKLIYLDPTIRNEDFLKIANTVRTNLQLRGLFSQQQQRQSPCMATRQLSRPRNGRFPN